VFGVPAKAAAEMIAEDLNKKGGIGGVPVKLSFIDEGAGGEALVSNYRRMVQDEKVDATFASISSGSCNQLVPVAEDLKVMNFMWDCGAGLDPRDQEVSLQFPHAGERHARDAGGAGLSAQDQARLQDDRGRQSGLRVGPRKLGDLLHRIEGDEARRSGGGGAFPKFGAPDYSTEVSRLLALRPDVVLTTSWGGDLDTLVRQAGQRGLLQQSTFVLGIGESRSSGSARICRKA
jgi:branched-chain amino acid transport system substrate-binding protein